VDDGAGLQAGERRRPSMILRSLDGAAFRATVELVLFDAEFDEPCACDAGRPDHGHLGRGEVLQVGPPCGERRRFGGGRGSAFYKGEPIDVAVPERFKLRLYRDVLGLGLLAVLTAVLSTGRAPDATELLLLAARIVAFFAITVAVGHVVFRRLGERIVRTNLEEVEFSALLIVALAFAVLAEVLGLHFILGAFMAGLMFVRRGVGDAVFQDVEGRVATITQGFLAPVFFESIGMSFEGRALGEVPGFVIVLVLTAFLVKAVAGLPALAQGLSAREAGAIGVGMSARGAVELVVADVALRAGLFAEPADDPIVGNLFSAVVVMAIVTTLAPSALLPWLLAGRRAEEDPSESS